VYVEIELHERGVPTHAPVSSFDFTVASGVSAHAGPVEVDEHAASAETKSNATPVAIFMSHCS
jgi:hypothetical protein